MNNKFFKIIFFFFLIFSLSFQGSCQRSKADQVDVKKVSKYFSISEYPPALIEKTSLKSNQVVTIAGKLRMVGSMPFTELVLTTESNFDLHIKFSSAKQKLLFSNYQGRFLEITGIITIVKMQAPTGKFLHNKYFISLKENFSINGKVHPPKIVELRF